MKIKYLALIIFGFILEFSRDYLFININLQIDYLDNLTNNIDIVNYTDSIVLVLLKGMTIKSLNNLKWILSFLYILLYFFIGLAFSYISFDSKKHTQFLKIFFNGGIIMLILSFSIYNIGRLFNLETELNFYYISLEISHFLQSLLYPTSFLLVFWSLNKIK
tara:strand:+ start:304 stop:789 length:486 start_codon:yes stop_codon:yes gene_type:complete